MKSHLQSYPCPLQINSFCYSIRDFIHHRHYIFHGQSLSRWKLVCAVIMAAPAWPLHSLTGKFRPALEALTNDFLFHLLFGKSFVGKCRWSAWRPTPAALAYVSAHLPKVRGKRGWLWWAGRQATVDLSLPWSSGTSGHITKSRRLVPGSTMGGL